MTPFNFLQKFYGFQNESFCSSPL